MRLFNKNIHVIGKKNTSMYLLYVQNMCAYIRTPQNKPGTCLPNLHVYGAAVNFFGLTYVQDHVFSDDGGRR